MEKPVHSTLPNGVNAALPLSQFRRIWQIWFALAPIAASRGEGIEITEEATGTYAVASVYAPQWESVRVVVTPDGTPVWCSEQSAPDMPSVDFTAPPPPAPWEKEGFEDRCRRRWLSEIRARIVASVREGDEAVDVPLMALGVLAFGEAKGASPTDEQLNDLQEIWPIRQ